jgi:hypothetical protein
MLPPRPTGPIRSRRFRLDRQLRATLDPRSATAVRRESVVALAAKLPGCVIAMEGFAARKPAAV